MQGDMCHGDTQRVLCPPLHRAEVTRATHPAAPCATSPGLTLHPSCQGRSCRHLPPQPQCHQFGVLLPELGGGSTSRGADLQTHGPPQVGVRGDTTPRPCAGGGCWPGTGLYWPGIWGPRPQSWKMLMGGDGAVRCGAGESPLAPTGTFIPVPPAPGRGPGGPLHSWRCGGGRGVLGAPPRSPPWLDSRRGVEQWDRAALLRPPRTCNTEVGCV